MTTAAPAIAMLAAFALAFFGARLLPGSQWIKGLLMLVMALVLIGNVMILTW